MNSEPIDRFYGTPLSEWLTQVPNELPIDAVGLWQIIPALRISFGLPDAEIERATRLVLAELLARGAHPIIGRSGNGGSWHRVARYGDTSAAIIDAVIAEWRSAGRDPTVGDVWFALPEVYEA